MHAQYSDSSSGGFRQESQQLISKPGWHDKEQQQLINQKHALPNGNFSTQDTRTMCSGGQTGDSKEIAARAGPA